MGYVSKYPDIVHVFVKNNCTKMRDPELAEICNQYFGTEFTPKKMKAFRSNHGYKNGLGRYTSEDYWKYQTRWPKGMLEFIKENSWGVSSRDMAKMVNEKFGIDVSDGMIKSFRQRHGIKSGETGWYQKGHSPGTKGKTLEEICKGDPEKLAKVKAAWFKKGEPAINTLPVGSITIRESGDRGRGKYKFIKIQMEGDLWDRWMPYQHYVWEQHYGPIPKGMCICFKDKNPMNCDISNLTLAKKTELATMARKNLWSEDPDLTETALNMIRLQQAMIKRRKNGND